MSFCSMFQEEIVIKKYLNSENLSLNSVFLVFFLSLYIPLKWGGRGSRLMCVPGCALAYMVHVFTSVCVCTQRVYERRCVAGWGTFDDTHRHRVYTAVLQMSSAESRLSPICCLYGWWTSGPVSSTTADQWTCRPLGSSPDQSKRWENSQRRGGGSSDGMRRRLESWFVKGYNSSPPDVKIYLSL